MTQTMQNIREARERESWRRTKVHFAVIGAMMLFALALLTQENTFHRMSRDLLALETARRELVEERDRLTMSVEQYRHPARIRAIAEERFGLTVPDPGRVQDVAVGRRRP